MSNLKHQMTVAPLDEGRVRLDIYLSRELQGMSRSKIQEMIEQGLVKVNDQAVNAKFQVKEGDKILYGELVRGPSLLEPTPMDIEILFEDDHIIVINKPAGIAVHPGAGETGATLVHGLLYHSQVLGRGPSEDDGEDHQEPLRPGIVHRLDKETTGVMVVAKTDAAHAHLSKQFHDKTNFRQYVALLNGPFPEGDWVRDSYLYRDPRDRTKFASMDVSKYEHKKEREGGDDLQGFRFARTVFKREAQYRGVLSLVSLKLFTGRTHQIRIHARDLGCSVVGDQTYGKSIVCVGRGLFDQGVEEQLKAVHRQMLHAWVLGFDHPASGEWMRFEAPLPTDFAQLVESLQPYRD
jgi:23S rRNA pseudouridine1911/1915/1917 synthase